MEHIPVIRRTPWLQQFKTQQKQPIDQRTGARQNNTGYDRPFTWIQKH